MANGKVITGYSKPYVALYNAEGSTVTYSNGMPLARGVGFNMDPETSEDNSFYADNIVAENEPAEFTRGTATITVDGLKDAANKLIYGLPTATEGWTDYDDDQKIPYVGYGHIVRYQEDGDEGFVPVIYPKIRFQEAPDSAETQEENIDWQTQELTAGVFRDDSPKHRWKRLGESQTTEDAADAMLRTALGITE